MQGVPRFGLRTRADFDLLQDKAISGEIRPQGIAILKQHWEGLLSSRWYYAFDRELAEGEQPDGDMPEYYVQEAQAQDGEPAKRVQTKRTEDLTTLNRLGFSVQDVEQAIAVLEAL
nr:hypothetical protein [Alcaligenes faecalis]